MSQLESAVVYNTKSQEKKLRFSTWLHIILLVIYFVCFYFTLKTSLHFIHIILFLFLSTFSTFTILAFWTTFLKFPNKKTFYHIPILQMMLLIFSILFIKVFFFINHTQLTIENNSPFRVEALYNEIAPGENKTINVESNLKVINLDFTCFQSNIPYTFGKTGIFPFRTILKYKIERTHIESGLSSLDISTYNDLYFTKFLLPNGRAIKFEDGPFKIRFQNLVNENIKLKFSLYDDSCSLVKEIEKVVTPKKVDLLRHFNFPNNPYHSKLIVTSVINGQYYRSSFWSTDEEISIINLVQ